MPEPTPPARRARVVSMEELARNLGQSGLLSADEIDAARNTLAAGGVATDGEALAQALIDAGRLTFFQADLVREGKFEELVIGNYEVLGRLGAGGMGTVYKARHRRMKRVVAIKVLSRSVAQSPTFVQRFQREVEAVSRLSHPNVVMAFDADEAEVGHYLVMEFVNGRDLASEVLQRGPLPVPEAVDCILQAGRALEYAHSQGIVHRDIKPANLLRDVRGVVKVADLGLARFNDALGRSAPDAGLTQAGSIMGTVDFMSPEQALGLTDIDHRADIYSLGCTLFFLLAGRPPFQGETLMATLLKHREAPVPSLSAAVPAVPPALDAIFRRMMAKKPEDRPASLAEVLRGLEALTIPPGQGPAVKLPEPTATAGAAAGGQTIDLPAAPGPALAGMPVLLVEPSRTQAGIIRKLLQELGAANVPTAATGQQAIELARATPPRVVLSSLQLADMTGMQLAHKMRAEPALKAVGFVLITSQAEAQQANVAGSAARTVLLPKPFDKGKLEQALAAVLAKPKTPADFRVLIVDDSVAARTHVRGVLLKMGFCHFVEATDGAQAIALLPKESFDLVVTDYNMPEVDGRGLLEHIRQRSPIPAVPVILVTTETNPAKLDAVRRLGVSAICEKSFRPEAVRGVIDSILGGGH
jgi:CheY-like chemotaxis protein/tRNA A-37 threonylcarbamoyl transferase component Bud32